MVLYCLFWKELQCFSFQAITLDSCEVQLIMEFARASPCLQEMGTLIFSSWPINSNEIWFNIVHWGCISTNTSFKLSSLCPFRNTFMMNLIFQGLNDSFAWLDDCSEFPPFHPALQCSFFFPSLTIHLCYFFFDKLNAVLLITLDSIVDPFRLPTQ